MIEQVVYGYLRAALSPTKVYMMVPSNPPDQFVTVEKTGSGRVDHIESSVFAIQSYGKTNLLEAARLNQRVKAAMANIVGLVEVSACRLNTDGEFTDAMNKRPRYQALFVVTHHEEV